MNYCVENQSLRESATSAPKTVSIAAKGLEFITPILTLAVVVENISETNHRIDVLAVLTQVASEHSYQFKYSLDFRNASSGTTESIIVNAIQSASELAVNISLGAATTTEFTPGISNIIGIPNPFGTCNRMFPSCFYSASCI